MPESLKWDDDFCGLMRRVQEGSEDAAWELVDQYGETIRRAVRRLLNERLRSKFDSLDFVQLVWNSLFRARGRLDEFSRPKELAAHLVTMARNKVGMEVRRRLRTKKYNVRREESLDQLRANGHLDVASRQPAPIDVAIAREQWNRILEGQPRRYQEIVRLRLQGYTYESIAKSVHLDKITVRRILQRLLKAVVV